MLTHTYIENLNISLLGAPSPLTAALLAAFMRGPEPAEPDGGDAPAAAPGTVPRIGQFWPGQGGIYAGQQPGGDARGDPHIILAVDPRAVFVKRMLGTYEIDVTGATSDYDGLANTIALAAAGSELCKEILALEIDGHKDWGLMARRQASLCWANVPEQFEKEWYLTSTQYSSGYAWLQLFSYGVTVSYGKKFEARCRVVRRLFL